MTNWTQNFIATHRVARLATVDPKGRPHAIPIVYVFDGDRLYTPIDTKPKRVAAYQLQRVRNIQANPHVVVLIDDYSENWQQLAWVQVRGTAEIVEAGAVHVTGIELLQNKYSQYKAMPLAHKPVIVITPERVVGWKATR